MSQTGPTYPDTDETTEDHGLLLSRRAFLNTGSSLVIGSLASQLVSCVGRAEPGPAGSGSSAPDIIFVRHAETIANATGRYATSTMNTFTAKGSRQRDDLVGKLLPMKPVRVVCSPIERCRMTITPYLKKAGLKAEIWPELAECCWQKDRGAAANPNSLHRAEAISLSDEEIALFGFSKPEDRRRWDINTYRQGLGMIGILEARLKREAQRTKGPLLVIGHSIAGSLLLGKLTGRDRSSPIEVDNASPILLSRGGGNGSASHRLLPRKG